MVNMKSLKTALLFSIGFACAAAVEAAVTVTPPLGTNSALLTNDLNVARNEFSELRASLSNPNNARLGYSPLSDSNVLQRLETFVSRFPNHSNAPSAELWLATAEFDELAKIINAKSRPDLRSRLTARYASIRSKTNATWHKKVIALQECNLHLLCAEFGQFRSAATNILSSADSYANEPNQEFREYFKANNVSLDTLSYDLQLLVAMSYAHESNFGEAVKVLQALQSQAPVLARKDNVDSAIEQLLVGKSPWKLPF